MLFYMCTVKIGPDSLPAPQKQRVQVVVFVVEWLNVEWALYDVLVLGLEPAELTSGPSFFHTSTIPHTSAPIFSPLNA